MFEIQDNKNINLILGKVNKNSLRINSAINMYLCNSADEFSDGPDESERKTEIKKWVMDLRQLNKHLNKTYQERTLFYSLEKLKIITF